MIFKFSKNLPPKKNLSCQRQIRLRRKIINGAAPRLRQPACRQGRGFGGQAPPFRIFAGGTFRKNAFGLIQWYCMDTKTPRLLFRNRGVLVIFPLFIRPNGTPKFQIYPKIYFSFNIRQKHFSEFKFSKRPILFFYFSYLQTKR